MFKIFEKQSYLVILLVIGSLITIFSIFDVKDISKLHMEPRGTIVWLGVSIGIVLIGFALFFYGQESIEQ